MSKNNEDNRLYSNLEMDFTKFLDIPTKNLQKEALFALNLAPSLGIGLLERANNLTNNSSKNEINDVKQKLYNLVVLIDRGQQEEQVVISKAQKKDRPLKYNVSDNKVKDFLLSQSESGYQFTRSVVKMINACENKEFDNLKKIISDFNSEERKQTDKDIIRTKIYVENQDGEKIEIKGDASERRKQLESSGLTKDDMNFLNISLNQTHIIGSAIQVSYIKNNEDQFTSYNANCGAVSIKVGKNGMESLNAYAKMVESSSEPTPLNKIRITTKITFDNSGAEKIKVPNSFKIAVKHENKNEGIPAFKNLPTKFIEEVANKNQEKSIGKNIKFYLNKIATKIKEIAKKVKSIFSNYNSKENNNKPINTAKDLQSSSKNSNSLQSQDISEGVLIRRTKSVDGNSRSDKIKFALKQKQSKVHAATTTTIYRNSVVQNKGRGVS